MITGIHNHNNAIGYTSSASHSVEPGLSHSGNQPSVGMGPAENSYSKATETKATQEIKTGVTDEQNLSEEEKRVVAQLKKIDTETKAHEKAHIAAGAGLVQGGASFTYKRGPDGRMYAVGGEVSIDTSPENDPDATIRKMQQVKRAAMAPSNPSGQDRAVAAQAAQTESDARIEKMRQQQEETETNKPGDDNEPSSTGLPKAYDHHSRPSEQKGMTVNLAV